ncbi:tRNA (adenosine(37)-N6)-dimethylallyltransferase MiaA [Flavihumibacter sp. ZG627]|uniref:tRNA (adenosine(37)-N6)-dimethylallyltransferase MiaA n=1 Tax=Flavihumibacter sp. ZG627 TaxID=1463156 RepID=UPI00057EA8CA|nr:tRNA (adenosine(37)-N6)-dimethylallyltransferase MiaA [Flavihumibacter sp. ZG627]KIC91479.1 tRNA delta(2)-isopentenylpyrophosphate transferase [Flavihumibacter sp. ZG627]
MEKPSSTCIIVVGPTAVGKTALAIRIAQHFKTEIISADSRQCYRELNIGVARPSDIELQQVKHHFIASHSIRDEMNAAAFESFALSTVKEIFNRHDTVVMVGGTGLYIKAFTDSLDELPPIDTALRNNIVDSFRIYGIEWLQEQIREKDPLYYQTGEVQNPQRLMRALEVVMATGQSIRNYQSGKKAIRPFRVLKIGLDLPRDLLYQRINNRVDMMMEQGLLDEVNYIYENMPELMATSPLQTVGYSELFDYLKGKIGLQEAIEQIKAHSRQYAKRQLTWFKKDLSIQWFSPGQTEEVLLWLEEKINSGK